MSKKLNYHINDDQALAAFDAVDPELHQIPRTVIALFQGIGLGLASVALAYEIDKKDPAAGH